jgi:hypothetical protein
MVLGSGIKDAGSGKTLFRIPDLGVKKGTGSAKLSKLKSTVKASRSNAYRKGKVRSLPKRAIKSGELYNFFIKYKNNPYVPYRQTQGNFCM